jgi:hypothetical protein
MLRRLMLHIVEEPVLWRKTEKVRASRCVSHAQSVDREGAFRSQEACKRQGCVSEEARV